MEKIKIAVVQMEVLAGHPDINFSKIQREIEKARENKADVVIFPEMAVSGYLLGDEWENDSFIKNLINFNEKIKQLSNGITIIWGNVYAEFDKKGEDERIRKYNTAFIAQNREWISNGVFEGHTFKTLMPKYREFDDERHFFSLQKVALEKETTINYLLKPFKVKNKLGVINLGLILCEDMWWENYLVNPSEILIKNGAEMIVNISCSPWTWRKNNKRHQIVKSILANNSVPFIYCNNTGIQNNGKNIFLFDGGTTIYNNDGTIMAMASEYKEETIIVTIDNKKYKELPEVELTDNRDTKELYDGLVFGLKKIFEQYKLNKAVIGISGGIDSAVSTSLLVAAIGKERVLGINMPSKFNSKLTQNLAKKIANNLNIEYKMIPIQMGVEVTVQELEDNGFDVNKFVLENIQARERGSRILAGVAASVGGVIINNSNKTEMALGYTTLYGDMNGAVCPLADIYKLEVYKLAKYINKINKKEIIPKEIFDVVPSAELSEDQDVTKGLGDPIFYPYHDKLVRAFVEFRKDPMEILDWYDNNVIEKEMKLKVGVIKKYFKNRFEFKKDLEEKWRLYKLSFFKRIQAPPIIAVSRRAFGYDLRESQNGVYFVDREIELH